jgi:zinc transport system substrate-binding protein
MLQRISALTISLLLASQLMGGALASVSTQPASQPPAAAQAPLQSLAEKQYASVTPALQPLKVVVSIAPLRGLIEPLLPPGSTIDLLIPPGVSEHGYEIPPAKLAALSRADLVVLVGMGMEGPAEDFAKAAQKPGDNRAVIVWEQLLKDRKVNLVPNPKPGEAEKASDKHNHKHNHAEGESCSACAAAGYRGDPHVWLDPIEAGYLVIEAGHKIKALRPVDVTAATHPVSELVRFQLLRLASLHRDVEGRFVDKDAVSSKPIVVGHDAFGWMAKRYNLQFIPVSGLNASEPKPADLRRAMQTVKQHKLAVIFTEPQISPKAMQRIAEVTGAKVDTLDPLGSGDYFSMMSDNAEKISKSLDVKTVRVVTDHNYWGYWDRTFP